MIRVGIRSKWGYWFNTANLITCIRIMCSIALLFCPVFSAAFYALYIAAGVTAMADGVVARKTGTVSEFGSKLDTAADFILVFVRLITKSNIHRNNVYAALLCQCQIDIRCTVCNKLDFFHNLSPLPFKFCYFALSLQTEKIILL